MPAGLQRVRENVMPGNRGATGSRGHKTRQYPHGGAFAGPVWAEKTDNLSFVNLEAEIVDGHHSGIVFGELFNFNHSICFTEGIPTFTRIRPETLRASS